MQTEICNICEQKCVCRICTPHFADVEEPEGIEVPWIRVSQRCKGSLALCRAATPRAYKGAAGEKNEQFPLSCPQAAPPRRGGAIGQSSIVATLEGKSLCLTPFSLYLASRVSGRGPAGLASTNWGTIISDYIIWALLYVSKHYQNILKHDYINYYIQSFWTIISYYITPLKSAIISIISLLLYQLILFHPINTNI
jgi:hypothetical protein